MILIRILGRISRVNYHPSHYIIAKIDINKIYNSNLVM